MAFIILPSLGSNPPLLGKQKSKVLSITTDKLSKAFVLQIKTDTGNSGGSVFSGVRSEPSARRAWPLTVYSSRTGQTRGISASRPSRGDT